MSWGEELVTSPILSPTFEVTCWVTNKEGTRSEGANFGGEKALEMTELAGCLPPSPVGA